LGVSTADDNYTVQEANNVDDESHATTSTEGPAEWVTITNRVDPKQSKKNCTAIQGT
jgi:hypothetical protein